MVYISCFYNHYNQDPVKYTFIQYEKYVKVILNLRSVILTNEQLVSNPYLFQIFKLSLLCTENSSIISQKLIDDVKYVYGVKTQMYWKNLHFTTYYEIIDIEKSNWKSPKNPLNTQEPNRNSGEKKIRKFMKLVNSYNRKIKDPNDLIREFYETYGLDELHEYFGIYIEYNKHNPKIIGLSSIMHNYGRDVYNCVKAYI